MYAIYEEIAITFFIAFVLATMIEGIFDFFDYTRHDDRRLKVGFKPIA